MLTRNMIALIDIGSAETKVLFARFTPAVEIVGAFTAPTEGMVKGEITDIRRLKESVHDALNGAEKRADLKLPLRFACLSLSGPELSGTQVKGLTSVKSENRTVAAADVEDARADAWARRVAEGRTIVHRIRQNFTLDARPMKNPEGAVGVELACNLWVVEAGTTYLTELIQIPNQYGMRVEEIFVASLAAASGVATGSEADKNRLVIDIGAGTTDYILYRDGMVVMSGVVPVGGRHLTNDISEALQISEKNAEWTKLHVARAKFSDADLDAEFTLPGTEISGELAGFASHYSVFKVKFVTHLRVREIFELVRRKIGEDTDVGSVRLTGGTSLLPEIADVAGQVFDAEVFLAAPEFAYARREETLNAERDGVHPKFSVVVGMAELFRRAREEALRRAAEQSFWTRLRRALFSH